jgi:hypothetical protein
MGDSNSGVVLGSRLLDTDRAATRQSGSPPGVGPPTGDGRPSGVSILSAFGRLPIEDDGRRGLGNA